MAYLTTYEKDYTRKAFIKSHLALENLREFDELPDGAVWLDTKHNVKDVKKQEVIRRKIKEMYKNRMKTVYRLDYDGRSSFDTTPPEGGDQSDKENLKEGAEEDEEEVHEDEDQLLETCKKVKLSKLKNPVLPPLVGARKILGYMNPKYFHTGNSVYQAEIGAKACDLLFQENLQGNRGFLEKDRRKLDHAQKNGGKDAALVGDDQGKNAILPEDYGRRRAKNCTCLFPKEDHIWSIGFTHNRNRH